MKINIYHPGKDSKVINDKSYLMISMTTEEAAATIASLAEQIRNHNPNSGRLESFISEGSDFIGYVSISVKPALTCIKCCKNVSNEMNLKLEKEGFLCLEHDTHREANDKEQVKLIENCWKNQRKSKKNKKSNV